jgi:hypothetical protein
MDKFSQKTGFMKRVIRFIPLPSGSQSQQIVPYLINTGTAASVLKRRLRGVQDAFDYALLDVQPQFLRYPDCCWGI